MRKSFYSLVITVVMVLGASLAANADSSQTYDVNGPNGVKTIKVDTAGLWVFNYTVTLNGGSGSYNGIAGWFTPGSQMTLQFADIVKGISYTDVFTGRWTGFGWIFGRNYQAVQAPEESSFFELLTVALALMLVFPWASRLRRSTPA